jgi:multicomponent Na+:H+ antiporter subunit D
LSVLVPLPVAVPLLAASVIVAVGRFLPPSLLDALTTAVAAGTAVLCGLLLVRSWDGTIVHWFGGWRPRHGGAVGISFVVDPFGAGLALFAAVLVTAVLVFARHYFDESLPLYHALFLVFLGAMAGFSLTGDLFNLFVFFELMSVVAYVLTAHAHTQLAPLQGALGFAVTNSIGGFLVLIGIALLYGRTGALNLAQIGRAVSSQQPDGLLVLAFALLAAGFLVKAAAVPFHFWLADAYAVAPSPVCALFSAVMSDLGLYALARVYWTVFSGSFGADASAVRVVFLAIACLTMLVGGVMAFLQRHLKRLLAFATISRGGLFLAGIALLTPRGLAGTSIAVVGDGFVKAALFLGVGVLVRTLRSGDELQLHGMGRRLPLVGVTFAVGALILAGLPPFAGFLGTSLIEESASELGLGWFPVVVGVSSALVAAALLRATGRVFLGLGPTEDPLLSPEADKPERDEPRRLGRRASLAMVGSMLVLAAAGVGLAFAPGLRTHTEEAALRVQDRTAYALTVLGARPSAAPAAPAVHTSVSDVVEGLAVTAAAFLLAFAALHGKWARAGAVRRRLRPLWALHSGHVGDYVAWLVAGTAALAVLLAIVTR